MRDFIEILGLGVEARFDGVMLSKNDEQGRQRRITYLSYGWQADRSTVYETQVATATLGTASTVAQGLAAQGYIITASGSTQAADGTGVLMVGTRVQGDTMPRPMMIVPLAQESAGLNQLFQQGYAIVGVSNEFGTGPAGVMRNWIGERYGDSLNDNREGNSHGAFQMQDPEVSFYCVEARAFG
jgi:hypothetical protein